MSPTHCSLTVTSSMHHCHCRIEDRFLTFILNCILDDNFDSEKDYKEEALKVIKKSKDTFEEFLSNPVELSEDRP